VKGQSTADAGATVVKEFDDMWPTENCFFSISGRKRKCNHVVWRN